MSGGKDAPRGQRIGKVRNLGLSERQERNFTYLLTARLTRACPEHVKSLLSSAVVLTLMLALVKHRREMLSAMGGSANGWGWLEGRKLSHKPDQREGKYTNL